MRDSQHLYRALIDACPDAVFFVDTGGVIRYANPAAAQMYGYSAAELEGLHSQALDSPASTPQVSELIRRYRCGETLRFEAIQRQKDGTLLSVEFHATPVRVEDEVLLAAFVRDISAKKSQQLKSKIRGAELDQMSRLLILSQLVTAIRHELNQPLAALRLYVDSAAEIASSHESSELKECLRRINDKLQQTTDLIHSKFSAPAPLAVRQELFNIHELINEVLDFFDHELSSGNINVTLDLGIESSLLLAGRVQIQQVLVHLIRNAIEALSAGNDRTRELRIATESLPQHIRVSVSDSGPGLDSTITKRLFVLLQTTKPTGLGLGLAISRHLIEGLGGELGLQSSSEQGTTFYFTLPSNDTRSSG